MPLPRYPDPASPYFIEADRGIHEVWHDHFGRLETFDCLAEARNYVSDREDEDEARAALEAREAAEAEADITILATLSEAA